MDIRRELEQLVMEAETALKESADCTTHADQNALAYMIHQAQKVLRGEEVLSVSGSREFMEMGESYLAEWMYSHYVMFGFGREEGKAEEYYGLKPALEYFRQKACHEKIAVKRESPDNLFYFDSGRKDYLLFSEEEWKRIRSRIKHDRRWKEQYEKIQAIADRHTLDEIDEIRRATWGVAAPMEAGSGGITEKDLYSDTAKGVSFFVPEGTAGTCLGFTLPENDADIQEFALCAIRIAAADGIEWEIGGKTPILLGKERANWEYPEILRLKPGELYTLHFRVNQRRKLKKGIQVKLRYLDANGSNKGEFLWEYNRKAWYPVHTFNLDMQCNAICYAVTGDFIYARKAIYQMLLFMDDFCQGATFWMRYNKRPEGRDNYGAVQAGRNLCSVAMTYVFIKDALAGSDRMHFVRLAEYMLNYVFDLRDRTCLPPERAQRGTSNWQTDMCIGAALIAAAIDEIPYRKQWIRNAKAVLSAQLACNLNADGSWPESLRYHHAALERFCTFARFWEHETGEDFFRDNHLERMFAYSIGVQMPPYAYFGNRIGTPPFGDHCLGGGKEYHILSGWIRKAGEVDPVLAAGMRETWERAGMPVREPGGEMVVAEILLAIEEAEKDTGMEDESYRTKSRAFPDAGLYLFRRVQSGACLAVMCNERKIGHGHLDQGSFLFYYHNVPLIMDSGIEGYFDATTQWHISSYSHACLLFEAANEPVREETAEINLSAGNFAKRRGWCDTPGIARLLGYHMGAGHEQIRMEMVNHQNGGVHRRTIAYKEDHAIVIEDEVREFEGEVMFCLPMLLKAAELDFSDGYVRAEGKGYYDVGLKVESLRKVKRAWIDWGRVTPMHPGSEMKIPFLRMIADAGIGFEILINACI